MNRFFVTSVVIPLLAAATAEAQQGQSLNLPRYAELPVGTQMHGAAVFANRLFVFGGQTGTVYPDRKWTKAVRSADIKEAAFRSFSISPRRIRRTASITECSRSRLWCSCVRTAGR
jgi:hypothetical protein